MNVEKPVGCGTFRRWIFQYQSDEVSEADRQALQAHLDGCEDCARRLEIENAFLSALKTKLGREPAPPGLETRIRAALERERTPRRAAALQWLQAPWFAAAAAFVLLAVLLVPWSGRNSPLPSRDVLHVEREVTVVDRDCDRTGRTIAAQRKCQLHRHLNVLKLADGTYWNISLDQEGYRGLMVEPEMRGKRLLVVGDYYPRIQTLQVHRTRDLSRDAL
jgi:mycothiol system anti-sigma-R factor